MRKINTLLLLSLLLTGCALLSTPGKKIIKLSSGQTAEVFFEKQISPEHQAVLVVDYKTEESNPREKQVEQNVLEIWEGVREVAEKMEIEEAVIRYKFFQEEKIENGQTTKLYTGLLFRAEKIENDTWKIDKIY